ncbi:acetoin utilization protein AcuC [Nonomuraea phyllanthi]|uniref:acetoin utilization protein AcuC n=1 Tax=Nonomuraea phyllanthi TaxID=2219224 RepID=UPI001293A9B5|nr:acetoin utilization protein AcuC [Nonomuraea phyllanthi]QFY05661.1 acetoin utilization protein AcuC [Nonomuraea phyllanthi]
MSRSARVIWDDELISYDFGPGHPLAPVRVELTMALARELGVLDKVEVAGCAPATDAELAMVHDPGYVEVVKRVSASGRPDLGAGLGTVDNPAFKGVHEASALIAGASLAAARTVWEGAAEHAVNVAGGLHHAMSATASGFCVYNDPALAIAWLLEQGAGRIAYVDVDVHHGDGVQAAFYDDPRVLTISLHESPRTLFPGTGFPQETGAEGSAVNVALPAGCGDAGWLRAFHAVVPPLLREFAPEILVTQHGCDSHALDPLANLMLSLDGQRSAYAALHRLAHETAGGRWVATGGGGYELVRVVPRAWTHLIAELAGHPVDPGAPTPPEWRRFVRERTGETPPLTMTDGRDAEFSDISGGYDPADPIDRAIMATRQAVFPLHGLDPMP